MTLDKAIRAGKEHRKSYRGSARFDKACRCHGSCWYCCGNRTHAARADEAAAPLLDPGDGQEFESEESEADAAMIEEIKDLNSRLAAADGR